MNYILGIFLLGTAAYCWKKFSVRDHESLWIQILCGLMGIFSLITAAPANLWMGGAMTFLALIGAGCCYFQCRRSAKKRMKRAVVLSAPRSKKGDFPAKSITRPLRKAV